MKITWLSNAPWSPSGYGEQTSLFAKRLRALGHEVTLVCNYGLHNVVTTWEGFTVYPADGSSWGNTTIELYAQRTEADQVIALCDAFVLHPDAWPDLNMAVWAPVDHYPIPPAVLAVLSQENVTPIAMSRFGERMMRDCKLDPLYVPHGYDPKVFRPMPEIRDKVRAQLGADPDDFLVGMVAANSGNPAVPRKAFPQALHAFANFHRKHPKSHLYVHTNPKPMDGTHGIDLDKLRTMVGIPDGRCRFTSLDAWRLGIENTLVATLYQAFDVLLAPSMGEGFGIPILEAQACGVPVITSDHSAMTELGQAGWLVAGDPWWDAAADSFFIVPFIGSITAALEAAYDARGDEKLRASALEFARGYDADQITVEYWEPALERLAPPAESRQVRRARERKAAKQKVAA